MLLLTKIFNLLKEKDEAAKEPHSEKYYSIRIRSYGEVVSAAEEGRRKVVYVCSPFSSDPEGNAKKAVRYAHFVSEQGFVPFVPHLLFPRFLDDTIEAERNMALGYCREMLDRSDELWVFGGTVSSGMRMEIEHANDGMPVKFFRSDPSGKTFVECSDLSADA